MILLTFDIYLTSKHAIKEYIERELLQRIELRRLKYQQFLLMITAL